MSWRIPGEFLGTGVPLVLTPSSIFENRY